MRITPTRFWIWLALLVVLCAGINGLLTVRIKEVFIGAEIFNSFAPIPLSPLEKVEVPYQKPKLPRGVRTDDYHVEVIFDAPYILPPFLEITSSACFLQTIVNEHHVLNGKPNCQSGHVVGLKVHDIIHPGENHLQLHLQDLPLAHQSPLGTGEPSLPSIKLNIGPGWGWGTPIDMVGSVAGLCFLLLLLRTPLAATLGRPLQEFLWAAFVVSLIGILAHHYTFLSNDIDGHVQYFELLYDQYGWLPNPYASWETYQPPLYYWLGLPFYATGVWLHATDPMEAVRFFSLCCYLVFLLYALATLRLFLTWKPALYMVSALLVLWPSASVLAGKINNDVLIYPMFAAALFYLLRWQREANQSDAICVAVLALLSVAVKGIGLLLCASVALLWGWRIATRRTSPAALWPGRSKALLLIVLALLSAGSNFGRTLYYRITEHNQQNFLIGNMTDTSYTNWAYKLSEDSWTDYVFFNPVTFLSHPFFECGNAQTDRYLFSNSLLKTLMFGSGKWKYNWPAHIVMVPYLLLLIYALANTIFLLRANRRLAVEFLPMGMVALSSMAGMMYMRIIFPVAGFGEARYIHFVVPWLLMCFARSIEWHRERRRKPLMALGLIIGGMLGISFVLFFIGELL